MPQTIYAQPDDGHLDRLTTPVPADSGWLHGAQTWITKPSVEGVWA